MMMMMTTTMMMMMMMTMTTAVAVMMMECLPFLQIQQQMKERGENMGRRVESLR